MTRVLGLDPGFAALGYAVVDLDADRLVAMGVLRTKPLARKRGILAVEDNVSRTRELVAGLARLLNVGAVCAEAMSFPRSSSAAAKVALCWGAIVALCEARDMPLVQESPQRVKLAVCGDRSASKGDVQFAVLRAFGNGAEALLDGVPASLHEHAYDAAAVVLACLNSDVVRALRRAA